LPEGAPADPGALVNLALARLRDGAGALFPGRRLTALEPGRVLDRPASRVCWVDAVFDGQRLPLVVKVPSADLAVDPALREKSRAAFRREHDTTAALGLPGVVRMVACFDDLPALVTEAVAGENLRDRVAREGRWLAPGRAGLAAACRAAGDWLRDFQRATARPGERFSLDEMAAYVDVRLKILAEDPDSGVDGRWRDRVLAAFERVRRGAGAADLSVVGTHGDFAPSNVLSAGDGVVVIDFSEVRPGSRYYDPTRFCHQLGLFRLKPRYRPGTIRALTAAFLEGYGAPGAAADPLFGLFGLQHTVCHWVGRRKRPGASPAERLYNAWVWSRHRRAVERFLREAER
jgi:aminoglycoside phosphotransferase (APT) family kinase protein